MEGNRFITLLEPDATQRSATGQVTRTYQQHPVWATRKDVVRATSGQDIESANHHRFIERRIYTVRADGLDHIAAGIWEIRDERDRRGKIEKVEEVEGRYRTKLNLHVEFDQ